MRKIMMVSVVLAALVVGVPNNVFSIATLKYTLSGAFQAMESGVITGAEGAKVVDEITIELIEQAKKADSLDEAISVNRTLLWMQGWVSSSVVAKMPEIVEVCESATKREVDRYNSRADYKALEGLLSKIKASKDLFSPSFFKEYTSLIEAKISDFRAFWEKH